MTVDSKFEVSTTPDDQNGGQQQQAKEDSEHKQRQILTGRRGPPGMRSSRLP